MLPIAQMCDAPGALERSTATPIARGGFCLGAGGGGVGGLMGVRPALPHPWGLVGAFGFEFGLLLF